MTRRAPKLPASNAALAPQLSLAVAEPTACPPLPVTPQLEPSQAVAIAEVLVIPTRLLPRMPAATSLACRANRLLSPPRPCAVTTSRAAYTAYRGWRVPVFTGDELVAITLAAEHDRASPAVLADWLDRKSADQSWSLTAREALGPVFGRFEARGWTLGQVLAAYDLELCAVGVGHEIPDPRDGSPFPTGNVGAQ